MLMVGMVAGTGRWGLVDFVCGTTMSNMASELGQIGPKLDKSGTF